MFLKSAPSNGHVDVKAAHSDGQMLLHRASENRHIDIVQLLLVKGAAIVK
jgi:ankyrin repeat protein